MAIPTGSDNKFPKIVLEEVANDGSATVTPAADHRALFLGEDGGLHLKDSAAAVTDIVGASAHIADSSDAHDASAISVADSAANFTGTDVEAVLAELQDNIDGVGGAVGNVWQMVKNGSSQTLTNGTDTKITFEAAGLDGAGSVIDLGNDQFIAPATGFYLAVVRWAWEATAPGDCWIIPKVGGSDVGYRQRVHATPLATRDLLGVFPLSLAASDAVACYVNPGAVTGVTARGSASVQLQTSFTLIRIT